MEKKINKYEIDRNLTYPENLVSVLNNIRLDFQDKIKMPITYEQRKGIDYVLSKLTERERTVVYFMFEENVTLQVTGDRIGVSRERVRQILKNALDSLRNVYLWGYLTRGYIEIENKNMEFDEETGKRKLDVRQDISVLSISQRTKNCLYRAGIRTIFQFLNFTEFYLLSGCGNKSIQEIISVQESLKEDFVTPKFQFTERVKRCNLSQEDKELILEKVFFSFSDEEIENM